MKRYRLNIYVEDEHAVRLEELAVMRDLSKSSIVASALAAYLSPVGFERLELNLAERFDALLLRFESFAEHQGVLVEALALFIRYQLAVGIPVAESQRAAVRAQGKERFDEFIAHLGRHLQTGNSLLGDLHRVLYPEQRSEDAAVSNGEARPGVTQ